MRGEEWYVFQTQEKREQEALELLKRKVDSCLFSLCRIPRKVKVFRSGGTLHLLEDVMFPGYVFVKTAHPMELIKAVERAKDFPQPLYGDRFKGVLEERNAKWAKELMIPVKEMDLLFLQSVCGEDLQSPMGVTRIRLDEERQIAEAYGILSKYLDRIIKLNLHKRFAVVEIPLFNRIQPVLFGVRLEQDQDM